MNKDIMPEYHNSNLYWICEHCQVMIKLVSRKAHFRGYKHRENVKLSK